MNPEVIQKLNLKETRLNLGQSFMYGVTLYEFTDTMHIAECNYMGEPTPGKCIILYGGENKGWRLVSTDFLLHVENDIILKALEPTRQSQ